MNRKLSHLLDRFLCFTRLEYWPVRVRRGIAAGARWTVYPWSSYWRGTQEPEMHAALLALGDITGWSCWDLGAHFGIYSIGLARRVGPGGEVAAFEPNPLSHARLEHHRRMNGLANLRTFRAAVSDHAGTAAFYTYGDLKSTSTHLPYENETPDPAAQPIAITTVVLDDLVAAGQIRTPDLVKIDVEGHAHHALAGAARALAAKRPILIVAIHSPQEFNGVLQVLAPLGYRHEVMPTSEPGADPIIGHDLLFTAGAPR